MNMVTQAIPATSALAERFLPGHRFSLVRLMSRAIGAPFLAIRAAVHAPARLLAGIERAGGAIQDRVRNGYVRARRGVEKSLSKGLKPNG